MKKLILILIIVINTQLTFSQIPNPGFESWNFFQPAGWRAFWTSPYSPVEPDHADSNAHSGYLAVKSEIFNILQCNPSGLFTGTELDSFYLPISIKPEELHGWYILNSIGNDKFTATVKFKNNSQQIGYGQFVDSISSTVYQEFVAPINYNSSAVPDSFSIALTFNSESPFPLGAFGIANCGSYFIVDDLSFHTLSGINDLTSNFLLQISPNPFNDEFKLTLNNNIPSQFTLYDLTSRKLIHQQFTSSITLNTSQLSKGIYIYEVRNKNGVIKKGKVVK
ncbi:MAG: T9SS type A sorting domain-containing protein, partial [Bacteroidia bacterium]